MKIEIECYQKVRYAQIIEVTEEEYEDLMFADGEDVNIVNEEKAFNILQSKINHAEIIDSEEEYESFTILGKRRSF